MASWERRLIEALGLTPGRRGSWERQLAEAVELTPTEGNIDDATTSETTTWSSTKIASALTAAGGGTVNEGALSGVRPLPEPKPKWVWCRSHIVAEH